MQYITVSKEVDSQARMPGFRCQFCPLGKLLELPEFRFPDGLKKKRNKGSFILGFIVRIRWVTYMRSAQNS